jgi:hypothetical protein
LEVVSRDELRDLYCWLGPFGWCWLMGLLVTLCKLLDGSLQHCHGLSSIPSPEASVHGGELLLHQWVGFPEK